EHDRMRAPAMAGVFPFPVKYGYATVGRIEDGPRQGEVVFALHPHQSVFALPTEALHRVPTTVPPARAALAANMETALNAIWDGAGDVPAPLGGSFHSRRLRLVSSQVGKVAPSHRPRWSMAQRLAAALTLLEDPVLDRLLAPAVGFAELPARLPELLAVDGDA